jgi:UDP:flavonoid glycosyltransferase YjiC (YdhE family)
VHHGGIGTTARALEAAVPQIISPQAFDQPDNGDRVSRLGVGEMIFRPKLDGASLAHGARQLLDSASVRTALTDISGRVRASNGVTGMADILERRFVRGQALAGHALAEATLPHASFGTPPRAPGGSPAPARPSQITHSGSIA